MTFGTFVAQWLPRPQGFSDALLIGALPRAREDMTLGEIPTALFSQTEPRHGMFAVKGLWEKGRDGDGVAIPSRTL